MTNLSIIKVGGQILEDARAREAFVAAFAAVPGPSLLVHGGGRLADTLLRRLGITPRMVEGRRLTDADTLEVVTMVYGGLVNKQVVASLQQAGVQAVGLSGADGDLIRSRKRPPGQYDYGFVGDIVRVETGIIQALVSGGYVPVLCPLTHDGNGQLLNTNADTIAMEVAKALSRLYRVSLRYCIDHPGVMRDVARNENVVPILDRATYADYRNHDIIVDGMIPKLDNAFAAREAGIPEVVVAGVSTLADPDKATRIEL